MIDKKRLKNDLIAKGKTLPDVIERLKQIDLNTNLDDGTALNYSVNYEKFDIVQYLLENGADVNSVQNKNFTPLMSAIEVENIEIIQLLLDNGADVTVRHAMGADALFKALRSGNIEIIELLLKNGSDPHSEFNNYTNYQAAKDIGCDAKVFELFEKYSNKK